jgi:hypothetical protein
VRLGCAEVRVSTFRIVLIVAGALALVLLAAVALVIWLFSRETSA